VIVALKMQVRAVFKMSGTPGVWKTPMDIRPADSITAACAAAEIIGPYCVGKDKIETGSFVVVCVTKRRRLNVYARYDAALSAGMFARLIARLPTLTRWISSKNEDRLSPAL
jgi:hypothetical protein